MPTGSGIVLVGYVDTIAGVVVCRECADGAPNETKGMESVYSVDVNEDTPECVWCETPLED